MKRVKTTSPDDVYTVLEQPSVYLGQGSFGCVVTNAKCPGTDLPGSAVASKLSKNTESMTKELHGNELLRQIIDPEAKFSISAVNACSRSRGDYTPQVKQFCGFQPPEDVGVVLQADFPYAGNNIEQLLYPFQEIVPSFIRFLEYVDYMHVAFHMAHFDVKPQNVVYDGKTSTFRLIDWSELSSKPSNLSKVFGYHMYPPEIAFLSYTQAGGSFPIAEDTAQMWFQVYIKTVKYAVPSDALRNEMLHANWLKFRQFIGDPGNFVVFREDSDDLWKSGYISRIDSFGLGIVLFVLSAAIRYPYEVARHHTWTVAAGLMSAVPTDFDILKKAIAYLKWILGVSLENPLAVRDASLDAAFPVFASAPIPEAAGAAAVAASSTHSFVKEPAYEEEEHDTHYESKHGGPREGANPWKRLVSQEDFFIKSKRRMTTTLGGVSSQLKNRRTSKSRSQRKQIVKRKRTRTPRHKK